jgi:phage anti-repressor protein
LRNLKKFLIKEEYKMNDLIKIHTDSDRPTVMGRELHEVLGINNNYTTWFKRMCEYGFAENSDFVTLSKIGKRADGTEMPAPMNTKKAGFSSMQG